MYAIWVTRSVTDSQAKQIERVLKGTDYTLSRLNIPGTVRTWIERPNDGTNDYLFRRQEASAIMSEVESIIGETK